MPDGDSGSFPNFQNDAAGAIPSYQVPTPYTPLGYQKLSSYAANVITAASWASTGGGQVTFTTTSAHGIAVGTTFTISGMTPAGYNGSFVAIAGTTGSTLVASKTVDPGAATVMGTLVASMTAATPLPAPAGARVAWIAVNSAGIRYRDDGGTPTTTLGYPVAAGGYITYSGPMANFQAIGSGATLDILYQK